MNQKPKPKPKPTTAYRKNKQAFDQVMLYLRRMDAPQLGAVAAMDFAKAGGSPAPRNPIAPSPVEFACDAVLAIQAAMPKGVNYYRFMASYFFFDSDDEIERSVFAQNILGGRLHSVEQRIGAEFVRRAIWPIAVYMYPPRVKRPRGSV